jgi:hypothetical protein
MRTQSITVADFDRVLKGKPSPFRNATASERKWIARVKKENRAFARRFEK